MMMQGKYNLNKDSIHHDDVTKIR